MEGRPTLYVLAGPEGSGKSTFYAQNLQYQQKLGDESRPVFVQTGAVGSAQIIKLLMEDRRPMVAETSFSRTEDVDLVRTAKLAGYRVALLHIQTSSATLAEARVAERIKEGGAVASAATVREDYARSAPLIAQASRMADFTLVYDSSALNVTPRHLITLERGEVSKRAPEKDMPVWAWQAYGPQLKEHQLSIENPAEKSFAGAVEKAEQLRPGAHVRIAGHVSASYEGQIVHTTKHHVLQQTGDKEFVAHFKTRIPVIPKPGQEIAIDYGRDRNMARVTFVPEPGYLRDDRSAVEFREQLENKSLKSIEKLARDEDAKAAAQGRMDARQFLELPRHVAVENPRIAAAYAAADALEEKASSFAPHKVGVSSDINLIIRNSVASALATGRDIQIGREQLEVLQGLAGRSVAQSETASRSASADSQRYSRVSSAARQQARGLEL